MNSSEKLFDGSRHSVPPQQVSLADALVVAMQQSGLSHVFGVSGANIEAFHDALARGAGSSLTSLLCKSERGAAFMADGFARQSGRLAVCCSTSGGGMMNLAVGLAESRNSGIPVLAIVGCPPEQHVGCGAFQDASGGKDRIDGEAMWRAIAKHVVTLDAEHFWAQWHSALDAALTGFPGPCVLLVPSNRFQHKVILSDQHTALPCAAAELRDFTSATQANREDELANLIAALQQARQPLLVVGPSMQNNAALIALSERLAIPVATTMESTAAFPHHHPSYLGVLGVAGHPCVHQYLRACDLVIGLGAQLDVMTRGAVLAQCATLPIRIYHTSISSIPAQPTSQGFRCDPNALLIQLLAVSDQLQPKHGCLPSGKPKALAIDTLREQGRSVPAQAPLTATLALSAVQPYAPYFDQFLFDAGNCASAAAHHLVLPKKAQSHIALGMGGMGYSLAAAIGMRLAQPHGQSLVICGDGAFLMEGMEIHTLLELQLPVLILIFNDSQHGMCVSRQKHFYANRVHATTYSQVNFAQLVRGLAGRNSCYSARVDTVAALQRAMDVYATEHAQQPGIIELIISQDELPLFYPINSAIASKTLAGDVAGNESTSIMALTPLDGAKAKCEL